jgi:hypothetical protein
MATQSQIDANPRNAQKSTGPRIPEGKAKSGRNALQHGLTAKTCMLADEDPDDLLDMIAEITKKFAPQDTDEDFLIERHELEKLQKIRTAKPTASRIIEKLRKEPDPPITRIKSAPPATTKPEPGTPNPAPATAETGEPLEAAFQWTVDSR